MADIADAEAIWKSASAELHKGDLIPSLWEAAARAKPITIDGDVLVLGLESVEIGLRGPLESPPNKARLRKVLNAVTGRDMDVRVVEGVNIEAWEKVKAREQETEAVRTAAAERQLEARAKLVGWGQLRDHLNKAFAEQASRRSPRLLAAYLVDVLPLIKETYENVKASGKVSDEVNERQLSRVIDKIAAQCNVPSTVVALELQRIGDAEA